MPTTALERLAAGLLALEALAVLAIAGWEVVALVGGDTDDARSAIALIVLTVVAAVVVGAFAVGVLRGHSWARSGGIVTQVLILAVALGALTGPAPSPLLALALAVPAVAVFVVIALAARAAAARRDDAA